MTSLVQSHSPTWPRLLLHLRRFLLENGLPRVDDVDGGGTVINSSSKDFQLGVIKPQFIVWQDHLDASFDVVFLSETHV